MAEGHVRLDREDVHRTTIADATGVSPMFVVSVMAGLVPAIPLRNALPS
jgi:hypothetical protein